MATQPAPTGAYLKPAEALTGVVLNDGWVVTSRRVKSPGATGGNFSVCYEVERPANGKAEVAFMKALDFSTVRQSPLPLADALQAMTRAYTFERDLVMSCATKGMRNVVRAVGAGQVDAPINLIDPQLSFIQQVPYIILEAADGDVRKALSTTKSVEEAWLLRVLHGVANGIRQLHGHGVTHQDLKPSNVMTFADIAKVGDLGRAVLDSGTGEYDHLDFAGDKTYAPPELLYGHLGSDSRIRTRQTDLYQLGSLGVFLYMGVGLTAQIFAKLDPAFWPRTWPRDYPNVLPYLRDAYDQCIAEFGACVSMPLRQRVTATVLELTSPDPVLRGNPKAQVDSLRCSMERYVSKFDLLARRAEHDLAASLSGLTPP